MTCPTDGDQAVQVPVVAKPAPRAMVSKGHYPPVLKGKWSQNNLRHEAREKGVTPTKFFDVLRGMLDATMTRIQKTDGEIEVVQVPDWNVRDKALNQVGKIFGIYKSVNTLKVEHSGSVTQSVVSSEVRDGVKRSLLLPSFQAWLGLEGLRIVPAEFQVDDRSGSEIRPTPARPALPAGEAPHQDGVRESGREDTRTDIPLPDGAGDTEESAASEDVLPPQAGEPQEDVFGQPVFVQDDNRDGDNAGEDHQVPE